MTARQQPERELGRYRLDHVLGSGAFATVWKGYDPELDTGVAIKILAENWSVNADVRERFLTEARLLRRIESPQVVRVHDVGVAEDRPFFVMDYIPGGTLADLIGQLEPRDALRLAAQAAYAVQVLHVEGIVHRDIKPTNLLVDDSDGGSRVLVADLGSAKMLADASGLTVTTGTPAYMAPEQADQRGGFDARADVYALGVMAYELASGRRPFDDVSAAAVMTRSAQVRAEPIARGLGLDPELDALLTAALSRDPGQRPTTAADLGDRLTALSAAPDRTPSGRLRSHNWPVPLVVVAAVLAFALAAAAAWLLR
ncbi:hypothetical protein GCM10011575_07500 [Microlunatus endophyticus]|uniref:non-specific serine/threonine protein kinase n=1 Tax=Microlunatus endophyticus TaxID=1716077 RepID=A0A917S297_9ACTN|nr:serine/threonine-protein kinase [Microlunatus endophyticus]GGL51754.1 hypothetical protein GCM10011575_07500 [Microlunatus endophyticus]